MSCKHAPNEETRTVMCELKFKILRSQISFLSNTHTPNLINGIIFFSSVVAVFEDPEGFLCMYILASEVCYLWYTNEN